jgi:hypothetical protein
MAAGTVSCCSHKLSWRTLRGKPDTSAGQIALLQATVLVAVMC